ncbi:hypothetical protein ABI59_05495 [Acidobacteria bacterium Mor1]|nr:hypothetical protein ABI59_05495 [Acidobacteria bacterium Mor1]
MGASLVVAATIAILAWPHAIVWAVLGAAATGFVGLFGGVRMAQLQGVPDHGFLATMFFTMAARVMVGGLGALAATLAGADAVLAYVTGLGCGFVPFAAFEIHWFMKTTPAVAPMTVEEEVS